ncbi:MAG: 5'-nucleotidase, partial [Sulfurimonas sp.]|nr:5'-nucleotidase [Sulfurimonas sp.]
MAFNLKDTLVIGISATALFDLSKEDNIFAKEYKNNPENAIEKYREYMLKNEHQLLGEGIGYPLIKALLDLNKYKKQGDAPLVEVLIMSRNSPDTGVIVLNNIKKLNLNITRSAFTAGESSADYL